MASLEYLHKTLERAPVIKAGDYDYFVHPVTDGVPFLSKALLDEVLDALIECADLDVDKIVTAEAMGLPIAIPLTQKTGIPTVVVRKRSYGFPGEKVVSQETGYRSATPLYINGLKAGDRVLFVDDVLSTGGTLVPMVRAMRDMGVEVVDIVIVINKHKDKSELEKIVECEIKSLVDVEIVDGKVVILG